MMNMCLIIIEGNYDAVDDDDSTCHGYYIIRFSSYPYTLQSELNVYGQVISSGEMEYEGTYYFPINTNSCYYVSPKNKSNNKTVSLMTIINGKVNAILYYSNDFVPPYLISI